VLVLMPKVFVLLAVIFAVIIGSTRYVSLGSICAAAVLPVLALFVYHSWVYAVMSLVIAVMVIYRHRSNIERLRNGTEKKITEKAIEYKD
jgi:Predicted membrane protein